MAEAGSWPSIKRHGLLSTTALLDLFEIPAPDRESDRIRPASGSGDSRGPQAWDGLDPCAPEVGVGEDEVAQLTIGIAADPVRAGDHRQLPGAGVVRPVRSISSAELETLLAPLSDRDQRRFSELAGMIIARQASPFAPRP
jgi:hypothetical protein